MTIRRRACIAGAFEHPTRKAPDKTVAQLHAECARGALLDAGLTLQDVDGYFCAGDAPGLGPNSMADYLALTRLRHVDSTDTGGSAYLVHVAHAAEAIALGKCDVALVTLAGRPRSEGSSGVAPRFATPTTPDVPWEMPYGPVTVNMYALAAARHMHEFGTTAEQLAWIKVAASTHAQHNPHAMLREVVSVDEVLGSPMISDPLHKLDCCVVSDGGGALVVTRPEVARSLARPVVNVLGAGETVKGQLGGHVDLTWSGAALSGPRAFEEAGVSPADIQYASIYDSFTITVLIQLEDLGFCAKGEGGRFVADGNLIAGVGRLPFNTDGGGLCNNHPANRGGMTKVIEAVRQLRGEAHPAVQVRDCRLALAQGTGGLLGSRHGSATLIMERE
ncbi:thiolase domain-containing protein [Piscinibacter koreensis]|uniref:Thiolase domain-containing protein n=1 Tax=Piscinibacter koreensis TaxID=2742824 RepID=A0A7Y6NN45_9BURK|nr:thiolase domain-containing protein [Schlegelella koreensis]NUZ06127.1 thiolase domain-containing protein [Schlegelella koreensis]